MFRMSRIIVITLTLFAVAAIVVSANWASRRSFDPSTIETPAARVASTCPLTVLPYQNWTSPNGQAPSTRYAASRGIYLITPSELAAAGFPTGTIPTFLGWTYMMAPGVSGSAPLTIYMQNTSDTINRKSTSWTEAIANMTKVHDATTTLPSVEGPFDITFSGGLPFTYTGDGLYIAYDWGVYSGPLSTTTVIRCNGALPSGMLYKNSAAATLNVSTSRPETRLSSSTCSTPTQTATTTPTNTATPTPTNTPISTLGNYADQVTALSNNLTVMPDNAPANTTSVNVSTDTNFKGKLEGDPVTGVVSVTNAHPAGVYVITVKAFDNIGNSATKTFDLTVAAGPACGPIGFDPAALYSAQPGVEPMSVAIGDFNRDGKQDLVTGNVSGNMSVMLGNGSTGFGAATNFDVANTPVSVAVGDFNGDGDQDLAAGDHAGFVEVLLGDGTGHFGAAAAFPSGSYADFIAVSDLNRDGRQDLAVSNRNSSSVSILLGDGTGAFGPPSSIGVAIEPRSLAVGDFNGDGNPDLVSVSRNPATPGTLSILLGDGTGAFGAVTNLPILPNGLISVAVGDMNGDGKQDIVTGTEHARITVSLGNGFGVFTTVYANSATNGVGMNSMTLGDFNGDSIQDVATANSGGNVSVLMGNGDGTLAPYVTFTGPGIASHAIAVGDFNGNSVQDIVFNEANNDIDGVWVFMRDCDAQATIRGTVIYGNSVSGPPRFVSNVRIEGTGAPSVATLSEFPFGTYSLGGFGQGAYTVEPDLTGRINGAITSFDAANIAQHVAGISVLTGNRFVVADVSGNGILSSFDAGQVARYVAAIPGSGSAGNWVFDPINRTYASITDHITGEDFSALLMGEVSGNWMDTGARPTESRQEAEDVGRLAVAVGSQTTDGKAIVVPIIVDGIANKGIISYEFDLKYDASVIQPQDVAADLAGTVSRGLSVVTNVIKPGLLRVVVYGALPIDDNGVLLNLKFTAVGKTGAVSPLSFERIMFNEGEERVNAASGQVEVF